MNTLMDVVMNMLVIRIVLRREMCFSIVVMNKLGFISTQLKNSTKNCEKLYDRYKYEEVVMS
jgi:hypothetical protein